MGKSNPLINDDVDVLGEVTEIDARSKAASTRSDRGISQRRRTQTVALIGLGYVGLPTGLAFHDSGLRVIGIDVSADRLAAIAAGDVDLVPDDRMKLAGATASDRFTITSDIEAVGDADAIVICVPTPVDLRRVPNLGPITDACGAVVSRARRGQLIVLTSTSYPGTTRDLLADPLAQRGLRVGRDVFVAFAPERIDPGNTGFPQDQVPRLVGGVTPACGQRAARLLERIAGGVHLVSSPDVAEMTKLHENTFRAVNISLANELADVCCVLGLDPIEVVEAAATKPYGFMPFYPGAGVGGHCIPVDPHYLLWQLRASGLTLPLIEQAMAAIAARPAKTVGRIVEALAVNGKGTAGTRVLVAGVTYKPDVSDVRMSPALEIIHRLRRLGVDVSYHDPYVDRLEIDGHELHAVRDPIGSYDLLVVHTPHGTMNLDAVEAHIRIDCTHRSAVGSSPAVQGPVGPGDRGNGDVLDLDALDLSDEALA